MTSLVLDEDYLYKFIAGKWSIIVREGSIVAGNIILRNRVGKFFLYVLLAAVVAIVPSTLLAFFSKYVTEWLGVNTAGWVSSFGPLTTFRLFFDVLLGPLIQTGILILVICIARRGAQRPVFVAMIATVVFASAHGLAAPLWFVGTAWSLFIYSYGFFLWRPTAFKYAVLAMYLPHALVNLLAITWIELYPA